MKCPECGLWNRASQPHCVRCGAPLNIDEAAHHGWKDTLKDGSASTTYLRADEFGLTDQTPEPRDELAREMQDLKQRKQRGAELQQRLRSESPDPDADRITVTEKSTSGKNENIHKTIVIERISESGIRSRRESEIRSRVRFLDENGAFVESRSYDPLVPESFRSGDDPLPRRSDRYLPKKKRIFPRVLAILAAVLVLAVLMKSRESYRLELGKIRISREYLRRILKIGIPAMLQSMTYSVTNVILQVVVNGFGTAYVAGWAACAKGDQLFWMLTQSFGIAVTTFVGQNYGAGHYQRVRKCIRQGFLIETILTLACVAFLWTATGLILSLFTTDKEVFDLAFGMMHFFIPCYVTWICNEIISSTLRGLGDSIFPMIISISGVCVFRIVWVLTAVRIWPQFRTIMLSYPISWVLTSILLVLYFSLVWMRSGRLKGIERPAGQKAPVW